MTFKVAYALHFHPKKLNRRALFLGQRGLKALQRQAEWSMTNREISMHKGSSVMGKRQHVMEAKKWASRTAQAAASIIKSIIHEQTFDLVPLLPTLQYFSLVFPSNWHISPARRSSCRDIRGVVETERKKRLSRSKP